jgi:PAS domain S-box-containing protein
VHPPDHNAPSPGQTFTEGITALVDVSFMAHFLRLFLPLALLLIAIAVLLVRHDIELHVQQHTHKEEATLEIAASTILGDIQTILRDIDYLGKSPVITAFAAQPRAANLDHLDQSLLAVSKAARFYDQVRLIAKDGREISRINRSAGESHIVPRRELQQKGNRYYLTEANRLARHDIYISPLDLNIEHEKLSLPHKPMLRLVALVRDSRGRHQGYLVFNYLADTMLANLHRITEHSPADFLLLNQDGDYLQAPDPADAWGFMFGNPGLFAARQPQAWRTLQTDDSGTYKDASGLYIFRAVYPRRHQENLLNSSLDTPGPPASTDEAAAMRWLLVSHLSPARQIAVFHENIEYAYLLVLLLLTILAGGCLLISKNRQEKESAITKNAAIANSSYEAIIMMDHHGKISFWNPAAHRIFGYTDQEALGRDIHGLIAPPKYRQRFKDAFPEFVRSGQGSLIGKTHELTGLRENGEEFPVELSLTAVRINNQWQSVALLRDISARKKVDEHLRKLSLAVEESPVSIVITDKGGRIEYVNPKFCEISQYSADEVVGANPRILKSQQQAPEHYREMWSSLMAGQEWHGEFANLKKNGELYWERASISPLRDEGGEITHFVAVKEDITQQKLTLEKLQKAKEEAEEANRAKSDFVANMSHEIRTPMNAIIGLSELALDMEMAAEPKNYFKKINQAGRSLLGIINDILDFSKIEAGGLSLSPRAFNLNEIMDGLASLFSSKVWEKNLELLFQIDEEVPRTLIADDMRLNQVLVNLIGNALKFTEQGEVLVRVKKISGGQGDIVLEFAVQDSGIGIDSDHLEDLFAPFHQADSSISRRYGGTGLGLTISRQLVELMGGHLTVHSEAGTGSTFTFSLPCQVQDAPLVHGFDLPPHLRGARVLVADDNEHVGKIMGDFLAYFDLRPTVVNTGQAALDALNEAAATDPFALLLIDWQMPGLNGIETCERLRADQRFTSLPILLLSGWNPLHFSKEAQGRVNGILSKPVTAPLLHQAILDILGHPDKAAVSPVAAPRHPATGARLLLAEDNLINREVALKILGKGGFRVESVSNGREAVEAITKADADAGAEPFAAILMDVQMPDMDGYEATRLIRAQQDHEGRRIPIIAMTAQAFAEDRDKCLAAGMDDFVSKPIDQEHLFATLARHIKGVQHPAPEARPADQPRRADQSAIDFQDGLSRLGGKEDFLIKMLSFFRAEYGNAATLIHDAEQQGDGQTAGRLAHSIAGAAANLGARPLARAAKALHVALEKKENFAESFTLFAATLQQTLTAIEDITARGPDPADLAADGAGNKDLAQLVAELVTLLSHNSYTAMDTLKRITEKIPAAGRNEQLVRLASHVENFQFQDALKIARHLQNDL